MVRLAELGPARLAELITDAWHMRAPEAVAAQFEEAQFEEARTRPAGA
jgi:hypothetical protein